MKRMKDHTIRFRPPSAAVRRADVDKMQRDVFGSRSIPYKMRRMFKHLPMYRVIINTYRR